MLVIRSGRRSIFSNKNKFSVSEFWKDIAFYQATSFGYVGEMCKYLLNAPEQALEKKTP